MSHDFQRSLEKGKAGEELFMKLWPGLERLDGRKSDFKVLATGELLELKSDSYDMNKTDNCFIELWSNDALKRPGGPMQAMAHGTHLWVYYFPKNGTCLVFRTNHLVDWLLKNSGKYKRTPIQNRGWYTVGIVVPRKDLEKLYEIRVLDEALTQDVK
jgi:hypothetical protein